SLTRGCTRIARNPGRLLPAEDEDAPRIRSVAPKAADSSERLRKRDSGSFESDLIVLAGGAQDGEAVRLVKRGDHVAGLQHHIIAGVGDNIFGGHSSDDSAAREL